MLCHRRKHTGEKPFKCHCGRQFSRLDNVRQHAGTVHADQVERNNATMTELVRLHNELSSQTVQNQMEAGMVIKDPNEASQARLAKKRKTSATRAVKAEREGGQSAAEEDAKKKGRGKFSVDRHAASPRARTVSAQSQAQTSPYHSSPLGQPHHHQPTGRPTYSPYSTNGYSTTGQMAVYQQDSQPQHHSPLHQHATIPQQSYYSGTPPPPSHSSPMYAQAPAHLHQSAGGPSSASPHRRGPTPLQTSTPGSGPSRYYAAPLAYGAPPQVSPGTAAREAHYLQQQQQHIAQQHYMQQQQQAQQQQHHSSGGHSPPAEAPASPDGRGLTLPSISKLLPSPLSAGGQADQQAYYAQEQQQQQQHSRVISAASYSGSAYGAELQQQQHVAMHHSGGHSQQARSGTAYEDDVEQVVPHSAHWQQQQQQSTYSIPPTPVSAISLPNHSAPSPVYATQAPAIKGNFAPQAGAGGGYIPQVTQAPEYAYQYASVPQSQAQQHFAQPSPQQSPLRASAYAQGPESSERSSIPWNGNASGGSNGSGGGGLMDMVVGQTGFHMPPQAVSSA